MSVKPKQKLPQSQKNEAWEKQNIDFFISEASFHTREKDGLRKFYDAYNGAISDKEYNYVTDPYGRKGKGDDKGRWNYPAKIRNFNILKPVIDLLMGEKSKRYMNMQVVVRNADVVSRQEEAVNQQVNKSLEQLFINTLNEMGVPTGVDSQQTPPPPEVAAAAKTSYLDKRAIMGQESIDYLKDYNEVPEQHQKAFFDWLVAGECYSYKTAHLDEVFYETVSPLEIDYDRSPGVDFIEDASWVVRRMLLSLSDVIDRFYDILKEEDLKALDGTDNRMPGSFFGIFNQETRPDQQTARLVEVCHIVWKTITKRGELSYYDEVGQPQKLWVDENYVVDKEAGETIKWYFLNEYMEGYKIDGKYYAGVKTLEVQRNQLNNKSRCKGPYNGRAYSNRHSENISIAMLGWSYQLLYNIYHYRFELTMAKSKDKIIMMEINAIPKRHGWDEDRFMYNADAMGFMFVDTIKDGKSSIGGFNQFQVLDASLGQYAAATMDVLRGLKQEWEELVGFNQQRKGQTAASEGLGKMQQGIFQSTVITEELFRRFEKWQETEYQGLLDTSKYAWRNGKKTSYVTSDQRNILLNIDPIEYMEAEYGIRVMNSGDENDKLNQLKQAAQAFAQNGSVPSTIADILAANSFAKVKELLRKAEAEQQRINQEQQQQEQVGQQQLEQMRQDALVAEREFQANENALNRQASYEETALINETKLALGNATPEDKGMEDELAMQELDNKRAAITESIRDNRARLAEDVRKREAETREREKDRALEREKIASQERIAKAKKPTSL